MSEVKITDLTAAASAADSDVLVIVDVANDTTKKITKANLVSDLAAGGGGLDSAAVQGVVDDNLLGGVSNTGVVIGPTASAASNKLQMTVVGPSAYTNGAYNVAIGRSASVESAKEFAVAIGNQARAGFSTGGLGGVSIGSQSSVQYDHGVAVGANTVVKGVYGVALGYDAEVRDYNAIAIGYGSLVLNGQNSISVGQKVIDADNAISISATGAQTTLSGQYSIDIRTSDSGSVTYSTDSDWQFGASVTAPAFKFTDGTSMTTAPTGGGFDASTDTIAIGNGAAANINAIAIGVNADATDTSTIAIGHGADAGTASSAVAIGLNANPYNFGVAIGKDANAGGNGNGSSAVVIGQEAGGQNIGFRSVAVGYQSGGRTHGSYSPKHETTHIGGYAGSNNPAAQSTGIGANAGQTNQGSEAVAIGRYAGNSGQGANSVAIGSWAAQTSQPSNSIAISAIGNTPTGVATPDGQYGIRIQTSDSGSVTYSTDSDWQFGASVTAPAFKFSDGTSMTTAPTGGGSGGLDSAAVEAMIDSDLAGAESPNSYTMKIGANASRIAIGQNAVSDRVNSISIGTSAGRYIDGGSGHVVIGDNAGGAALGGGGQAHNIIAIGTNASTDISSSQYDTIAMGYNAGRTNMGNYAIAIGYGSSISDAGEQTVAIGYNADATGARAIAVGSEAEATGTSSMAIGASADAASSFSTALSRQAKAYGHSSLTIGYNAGNTTGGDGATLIGTNAGQSAHQRLYAVAVGMNAQLENDANVSASVAVGYEAGQTRQESSTVAIGYQAGQTDQLNSATAVGFQAGNTSQGGSSVAIGRDAAFTGQATNSVAIGRSAGYENQGTRSIAIGRQAGVTNQGANNIILNATSSTLNRTDQFGIDIRTSDSGSVTYDTTNDWTFGATVNAPAFVGDGSQLTGISGGSGGLDSAAVNAIIDSDFNDPQQLTFGGEALAITVGKEAATHSSGGVAIGSNADASGGVWNLAIGNGAKADTVIGASALGHNALARGSYATAIGRNAVASTTYAQALGYTATASGYGSLAVGWGGEASGQEAVGVQGVASGSQSVAVGKLATASGNESIAIGKGATASQVNSIAIGGDNNTFARSLASICIGEDADNADATNNYSIVIGKDASVTGTNNPDTVTIGRASRAGGSYAIGLGYLSRADAENALVINASGTNREVTSQFGIDIRTSAAGSLTYDTTNDWTFGAGVTMTDLTASGATVVFSNLPTTDPVNAGQLWNDLGTLKISAG